jgi:hypothetical protein
MLDLKGLEPVSEMVERFYEGNSEIKVLQLLHTSRESMSEIVAVKKRGRIYSSDEIFGRKEELLKKYSLLDFHLIHSDTRRGVYTALITHIVPHRLRSVLRGLGQSLFLTMPVEITPEGLSVCVLVDEAYMERVLESIRNAKINFQLKHSTAITAVSVEREERRRLLLRYALESGYFETPRKQSTANLARIMNVSPAAASKAIRRAVKEMIAAYLNEDFRT